MYLIIFLILLPLFSDVSSPYVLRHAGVLGLSSCIKAFPYDVPDWMPQMLVEIGEHLHDPNPIQVSIAIAFMVVCISFVF